MVMLVISPLLTLRAESAISTAIELELKDIHIFGSLHDEVRTNLIETLYSKCPHRNVPTVKKNGLQRLPQSVHNLLTYFLHALPED